MPGQFWRVAESAKYGERTLESAEREERGISPILMIIQSVC